WRGDLAGREGAGGDLVQQRLKQVVIAAIDQGDVDRCSSERPGRAQTAEAAADDDDAVSRAHALHSTPARLLVERSLGDCRDAPGKKASDRGRHPAATGGTPLEADVEAHLAIEAQDHPTQWQVVRAGRGPTVRRIHGVGTCQAVDWLRDYES